MLLRSLLSHPHWHKFTELFSRRCFGVLLLAAGAALPSAARADWQAIEKVESYAIEGRSGPELYASIGQRGPVIGKGKRTIAYTTFVLTWQRDYRPQGNACVLVSARPKLTIIYKLPKPSAALGGATHKTWEIFFNGVRDHERVHGEMIKDMVKQIEAYSVGLTVADDPSCRKIREQLTARLSELSQAQRQRSRDFDKVEFGEGGNLQRLVYGLVTGG